MTLDEQWFKDAKEFCLLGRVFASQRNDQKLELRFRVLRSVVERISQRRKRLVFVGAFSAGKTTVLNNLMEGAKIKLPTGLSETTAIPTVVHPSERVAMFLWADDRLVEAEEDVMNEFLNFTRDKIGPMLKMYLKSQDEVVLHVPMHGAFRDLEFVDLPGLLGSHSSVLDEKAFLHALASDGVLYVVNAKQGELIRTDREFISKVVQEGVPVLVIATHMDQLKPSERESVVTQIRKQIGEWKGVVEDEVLTTDPEASGERIGALAHTALFAMFRFIERLDDTKCLTRNFNKLVSELDLALSKGGAGQIELALRSLASTVYHAIEYDTPPYKQVTEPAKASTVYDGREQGMPVWNKRSESLRGTNELILKPSESRAGAWWIAAMSNRGVTDWLLALIGALPSKSYSSPSWATAVKKDGAWHIVVNGNIVAGPYQDAETPTLSPSGDRWASKVLLQEGGWTIAFNAVDESKEPKLFPKTFDLVSKPWFVMGGGILFAGLKGDVVELYLVD